MVQMSVARTLDFIAKHPLTRKRPLPAIARFVTWQVRSRLQKDVEVSWIGGTRVIARNGMTGITGNIYCGLHEFYDMGLLLHLLRPGDLFIDAGANVGSYTLLASGVCGANTLAFEPDPDTAFFLRRNVEANGLGGRVAVHQVALGDETGEVDFTVGRDTTNQVVSGSEGPTRRVSVRRLDDFDGAERAILMKLDVEGFEDHVLAGAERVLSQPGLLAIQSEGQTPEIVATLGRHGFERAYYDPTSRTFSPTPIAEIATNGLFVRDLAALAERARAAPKRDVLSHSI
jgi:FkbM family methyltransferase